VGISNTLGILHQDHKGWSRVYIRYESYFLPADEETRDSKKAVPILQDARLIMMRGRSKGVILAEIRIRSVKIITIFVIGQRK
jgi:hypothetical protein